MYFNLHLDVPIKLAYQRFSNINRKSLLLLHYLDNLVLRARSSFQYIYALWLLA